MSFLNDLNTEGRSGDIKTQDGEFLRFFAFKARNFCPLSHKNVQLCQNSQTETNVQIFCVNPPLALSSTANNFILKQVISSFSLDSPFSPFTINDHFLL